MIRRPAALNHFFGRVGMLLAEMMGRPDSARMRLPHIDVGALEPHDQRHLELHLSRRAHHTFAITSHFMIPPKILTRIALRLGFLVMI